MSAVIVLSKVSTSSYVYVVDQVYGYLPVQASMNI